MADTDILALEKAGMRREALARRARVHDAALSARACELLAAYLTPRRGQVIAGYLPIGTETDPRPAMAELAAHGQVAAPVVVGKAQPLIFRAWHAGCALEEGAFGTKVPAADAPQLVPDVIIVPLVSFDRAGRRLGYGGGFYDRTLAQARAEGRDLFAVGFAYGAQAAQRLPEGPFDEGLDAIVTEDEVLAFR